MITRYDKALDAVGRWIAGRLETPSSGYEPFTPSDPQVLERILLPADVLLIEGNQKVATAIKYLTQSTWSHAALYIGEPSTCNPAPRHELIEANLGEGVVTVPLSKYARFNTRICRAVGLNDQERQMVVAFAKSRVGHTYDTRNIVDLARYLLPTPPVPTRWRRRMIALGSGEPSRAICSTLIAQAFQSVRYPILPRVERLPAHASADSAYSRDEILHIRHHSLFAPRDFDLSPYFAIVKPTIADGFDHRMLRWASPSPESTAVELQPSRHLGREA